MLGVGVSGEFFREEDKGRHVWESEKVVLEQYRIKNYAFLEEVHCRWCAKVLRQVLAVLFKNSKEVIKVW